MRRPPDSIDRPRTVGATVAAACLALGLLTGCSAPADSPTGPDRGTDVAPSGDVPAPEALSPATDMPSFDVSSVAGSLVDGFPADVVPVPPEAQVLASSAADVEGQSLRQVTLNLSSTASVQELLDFYAQTMAATGFSTVEGSSTGGLSGQVAFNRATPEGATETLFVGVLDTEDARLVTVSGQVAPPA
ncbi:hypothetical protein [Oerskovia merdavium]|uniref:Lipoprotein n=1 Tax=Oerskovia merdavium TaxID=2762227 RepID=A0ABR8TZ02_9CELL|nr:hypothetical protein [Oerskovia merdavium]MBD7981018.1 hypothetical protein [Oerskovia merdavium]